VRVESKRVIVMPGVFWSFDTVWNGGNSSTWAWPPWSWSSRVLSSPTVRHVTLSR
jgi:hypothetical protein